MFCAKDVCDILGYKNQSDAIQRHVEKFDVVKRDVKVSGSLRKDGTPTKRSQQMIFVNESDLQHAFNLKPVKQSKSPFCAP